MQVLITKRTSTKFGEMILLYPTDKSWRYEDVDGNSYMVGEFIQVKEIQDEIKKCKEWLINMLDIIEAMEVYHKNKQMK